MSNSINATPDSDAEIIGVARGLDGKPFTPTEWTVTAGYRPYPEGGPVGPAVPVINPHLNEAGEMVAPIVTRGPGRIAVRFRTTQPQRSRSRIYYVVVSE